MTQDISTIGSSHLREVALQYIHDGHSVVPIREREKRPAIEWEEFQTRIPAETEVNRWFSNEHNQVGIVCGRVSGNLVVFDFDGDRWEELFDDFIAMFPELLDTRIVITGSDKIHIYARCAELPEDVTRVVRDFPGKGEIELRANRHYVLAPPSIHPNGNPYRFYDPEAPILEISQERLREIIHWLNEGRRQISPPNGEEQREITNLTPDQGLALARFYLRRLIGQCLRGAGRNAKGYELARRLLNLGLTQEEATPFMEEFQREVPPRDHLYTLEEALASLRSAYCNEREVPWIPEGVITTEPREDEVKETQEVQKSKIDLDKLPGKESERGHHFNLIRAKDIVESEDPETEWVWEGGIPCGGSALIVAKPKVGKTTMATNLAVCVARGQDFLGRKTKQCNVVYLALEQKKSEMKRALQALGVNDEPLFVHFGQAPHSALKEVRPLIKDTGAKLLIIDILQKFFRAKDIKDYSELTSLMEPIIAICLEEDCAVVFNHHAGKQDRPDGDDILGSTALLGGVDTAIIIKKIDLDRPPRQRRRIFFTIQRYGEDMPQTILRLLPDGSLETAGTLDESELEDVRALIMETLHPGTQYQEKEIKALVKKGSSIISEAIRELQERGELRRSGKGVKGDPYTYEKYSGGRECGGDDGGGKEV